MKDMSGVQAGVLRARSLGAASAASHRPDALGTAAVIIAACLLVYGMSLQVPGPLTRHMLVHVVLMNAVAPLLAKALAPGMASGQLIRASSLQLALLWVWHTPSILASTLSFPLLHLLMLVSLTLAAMAFWSAVFAVRADDRWKAILALLFTGKFVCLLGALLVFAPRALFDCNPSSVCGATTADPTPLEDQQMAGLIMIAACPLTYVTAGVVLTARWLRDVRVANASVTNQQET